MSVLMVDRSLGVRRRASAALDAHGEPAPGGWGPVHGPWPGRAREAADGSWSLAVDPAGWPVQAGDIIVQPDTGTSWLVVSANLLRNNLDPTVDYIRVDARERVGAATEPVTAPQPTTR